MSLDPSFAEFLDFLDSVGAPGPFAGEPAEMRSRMADAVERAWDPGSFAPVASESKRTVGVHDTPVTIYLPLAKEPALTVLYFHPGGFVMGSAHLTQDVARRLSHDLGAAVVNVDYRLAPEHPFPAAVEDAASVLQWAQQHIGELGGDASRIALVGESSGANLAAVAALDATRRGSPVSALLLASPVTDFTRSFPSGSENAEGYFLEASDLAIIRQLYFGGDPTVATDNRVSPALAPDLPLMPRTVVGVAGFDPLRDDGVVFAGRLLESGVPTTLRVYPDLIHPFFGMPGISPRAKQAVEELTSLLGQLVSADATATH